MGLNPQKVIEVDRIIHEPARLLIMTILSAVESADFLYINGTIEARRREETAEREMTWRRD